MALKDNDFNLTVLIQGKPMSQERPFFNGRHVFDRPKSRARKKEIAMLAKIAMGECRWKLTKNPVKVIIAFVGAHGKSDLDNLIKLILDALTGVAWEDDRQVWSIEAAKFPKKEYAQTYVIVEEKTFDERTYTSN